MKYSRCAYVVSIFANALLLLGLTFLLPKTILAQAPMPIGAQPLAAPIDESLGHFVIRYGGDQPSLALTPTPGNLQHRDDLTIVDPNYGVGSILVRTSSGHSLRLVELPGSAATDVTIRYTVPVTPVQPHTLYAVIDPDNEIAESNEANGVLTLTTVTPDVAVASVKTYYYDQRNVVPLAVVANNGPVTATNVLVEFRAEAITGTVEHTAVIAELAPQDLVAITTTWNVAGWEVGEYIYYAVVDSEDTIFEINEEDNWDYFPV